MSSATGDEAPPRAEAARRLELARARAAFDAATPLGPEHLQALALVGTLELGSALSAGIDATLQRIVETLQENLEDVLGVSVILWSATEDVFTTAATTVPAQVASDVVREVRSRGATHWIVSNAEPLCVNDIELDPFGASQMLRTHGSHAYLGVPILDEGVGIGVVYAMADRRDRFDAADVRLLTTIADRCGAVIRASRTRERTLELLDREQQLARITNALAGLSPLADRLGDVVERLSSLLHGSIELQVDTPTSTLHETANPHPSRREREREIGVSAGTDEIHVLLGLRAGRSSPPDQEAEDVLRAVAETIGVAAARDHATEALRESNAALEQFAHVASHDLKSPLSSVIGFLDLVLSTEGEELSERTRMLLGRALDGGNRMRETIDALLTYAKVPEQAPERVPTPLGDIVGQALGALVSTIEESHAEITVREDLPIATVDPAAFRIVVQNLLANALTFVAAGRRPVVEISGRALPDGTAELAVEDQGIGVAPDDLERVFDLFQRASNRHPGSGIGLATVRRIVRSHGGDVWMEPGRTGGTRVMVRVPPVHDLS